jgi:hypothetical protein
MEQSLKEREVDRKRAMEMEEGPVSDNKKKKKSWLQELNGGRGRVQRTRERASDAAC